jgi:hypothetical protein
MPDALPDESEEHRGDSEGGEGDLGFWRFVRYNESAEEEYMTVSIRKHLDSDTIHLPEAQGLIGKDVRIILIEEPDGQSKCPDFSALDRVAGNIDLDYQAIEDLRKISMI